MNKRIAIREFSALEDVVHTLYHRTMRQNKRYIRWVKKWAAQHPEHVDILPKAMQWRHLEYPVGILHLNKILTKSYSSDGEMDFRPVKRAVAAYKDRLALQKVLFEELQQLDDPQHSIWKQHLYLCLARSSTFAPQDTTLLLYPNTNLHWIVDSLDYVMAHVDEEHFDDAALSLYSGVGMYLQSHDQTLDEVLETMPSEWLLAAAWDGTVKHYQFT